MLTTLNSNTQELLETVALPMLAYTFQEGGSAESNLTQVLLQGQRVWAVHQTDGGTYSVRYWLGNPLWNNSVLNELRHFLQGVALRLTTDAVFRRQIARELQRPPIYQSDTLRPIGDDNGEKFPMLSLVLQLQ